ncbi:MAG: HAMP domain-containing sensor histidine kinase [Bacillota bacterium]|nr:HAMP domain-containing sensor histidine kinase [Bacillota bacterium]
MSVRLRLTLWYSGVLAFTLLLLGLLLYTTMSSLLLRDVDRNLATQASSILRSTQIQLVEPFQMVVQIPPLNTFATAGLMVQVYDLGGNVRARSANLGDQTLPFERLGARRSAPEHPVFVTYGEGRSALRTYQVPITIGDGKVVGVLEVAQPLLGLAETLERLRFLLIAGSLLTVVAAGAVGWLLASLALSPIDRITQAARSIGRSRDFSRRVAYEGPQDEIGTLVATFNQMLEGLQAAHDALQQSYDAQRRFLADVSHELRTPLTVVRGNVEYLRRTGGLTGDEEAALQDIGDESERMSRLVSDLLLLARADAGQHLRLDPVEPVTILRSALRQARVFRPDVQIVGDGLERIEGSRIRCQPDYFKELFMILLDNAVRHSPPGGTVRLEARRDGEWLELAVRDQGPGIPPEEQERIFERFYRGRAENGRARDGTGLGLSIARWIAQEHGGSIRVESQVGQGARFVVRVPLLARAEEASGRLAAPPAVPSA